MSPRVFFGTMYSGEAEFEQCKDAIYTQRGIESFQHAVIEGLPEKEAHNTLWKEWELSKDKFDLFVKVDADTILSDPEAVSRVWQLFSENPRVTGAQLRLFDFFTGDLIAGLNFFSPVVKFNTSPDLYCDRVDTNHDVVMKGASVKHLEPIGFHCKNPNDGQAFHFGLHRMLKGQSSTLRKVWDRWSEQRDRARELALLGAAAAHFDRKVFERAANSYNAEAFAGAFQIATEMMSDEQREKAIKTLGTRLGWTL